MGSIKSKSILIILYASGLSLLLALAIWQYQRGIEKQEIAQIRAQSIPEEITSAATDWNAYVYRNSALKGHWQDGRSFVLENKIYKGQVGFEVLTPFRLQGDDSMVLVNRGWVASPDDVHPNTLPGQAIIRGVLYVPDAGVKLGEAILPDVLSSALWPKKSLYIDLPVFASILETDIEPVVFVLDAGEPSAYVRIWKAAAMPAAKHFAYAVQWLGLALTFIVYGIIWYRRRS